MSDIAHLHALDTKLSSTEITAHLAGPVDGADGTRVVLRREQPVSIDVLDDLMAQFEHRRTSEIWPDRAASDRWLAPRLHHALRLTRAEAADRGIWQWIAFRYADIVFWRWGSGDTRVAQANRWHGPIHKQAFARLWWSAELFRDGADYRPVERALVRQDIVNSYLHRPVVRYRSLALALLDVLAPAGREDAVRADEINDVARTLNLIAVAHPPEPTIGYRSDDRAGYRRWLATPVEIPSSWDDLPSGPPANDTTSESVAGGLLIAQRSHEIAARVALSRGTRSAARRGSSRSSGTAVDPQTR